MLRSIENLWGHKIQVTDEEIGAINDLCFDDSSWNVLHIVVQINAGFLSRQVLISPDTLAQPDWEKEILPALLPEKRIGDSGNTETDSQTCHAQKDALTSNWPLYWGGGRLLIAGAFDASLSEKETLMADIHKDNSRLQSAKEVIGYTTQACDGKAGRVAGLIVNCETWHIPYMIWVWLL